jgi:hypothetical protein
MPRSVTSAMTAMSNLRVCRVPVDVPVRRGRCFRITENEVIR